MRFAIYRVENGYLLNITLDKRSHSYVYSLKERMTMLAKIDSTLGEEPPGSVGMEDKEE